MLIRPEQFIHGIGIGEGPWSWDDSDEEEGGGGKGVSKPGWLNLDRDPSGPRVSGSLSLKVL
jgi:hypothetical protein